MTTLKLSDCRVLDPQSGGGPVTENRAGRLIIDDGRVASGPSDDPVPRQFDIEIDLSNNVVIPGLINCHDHLQLNAASGLRPDRKFTNSSEWVAWLGPRVGLGVGDVTPPSGLDQPLETRLWHGALKNVLCGSTTVAHHDPGHEILADPDLPIRLVSCGWAHSPALAGEYGPSLEESWKETPPDRPWVVHLAEGLDQQARTELDALIDAGCLDSQTVAVHAVGLDDEGRERLLDHGGSVVWCPSSNLVMLGATLDPRLWIETGGRSRPCMGIGTDSRLTGERDLLDELRVAAAASGLEPLDLVRLVTTDAARIMRLESAGRLDPGSPADLIVLGAGEDPWQSLLEAERADLRAVALAGRPVITDPDFESWFVACGIEPVGGWLDGVPKLMDPAALGPAGAAELEPGLEVLR